MIHLNVDKTKRRNLILAISNRNYIGRAPVRARCFLYPCLFWKEYVNEKRNSRFAAAWRVMKFHQ